ncbi:MAG: MaoC family dehydratase N-terminal domain-containing protein [Dethiobacteria bacterium]
MKVNSDIVGKKLSEFITFVDQRKICNYAAAVSDPNPFYLDDQRRDGLIAPPTLAAAITWPLLNNIYDYIDLGYPPEVIFNIVHYSEYLELHRPLRPGDKVIINGEVAAVLPEKRGAHIIFKLPAVDKNGDPLFTEYIGGMLRGIECADQGRSLESLPITPSNPTDHTVLWEVAVPIPREACYIYEGCANVPFPIHTSPAFALSVGLPDIIYYGIASLAHAVREIVNRENRANPSSIKTIACRFRGMVLPDSFIRIQLTGRSLKDNYNNLFFRVLNREGKETVSEGFMSCE